MSDTSVKITLSADAQPFAAAIAEMEETIRQVVASLGEMGESLAALPGRNQAAAQSAAGLGQSLSQIGRGLEASGDQAGGAAVLQLDHALQQAGLAASTAKVAMAGLGQSVGQLGDGQNLEALNQQLFELTARRKESAAAAKQATSGAEQSADQGEVDKLDAEITAINTQIQAVQTLNGLKAQAARPSGGGDQQAATAQLQATDAAITRLVQAYQQAAQARVQFAAAHDDEGQKSSEATLQVAQAGLLAALQIRQQEVNAASAAQQAITATTRQGGADQADAQRAAAIEQLNAAITSWQQQAAAAQAGSAAQRTAILGLAQAKIQLAAIDRGSATAAADAQTQALTETQQYVAVATALYGAKSAAVARGEMAEVAAVLSGTAQMTEADNRQLSEMLRGLAQATAAQDRAIQEEVRLREIGANQGAAAELQADVTAANTELQLINLRAQARRKANQDTIQEEIDAQRVIAKEQSQSLGAATKVLADQQQDWDTVFQPMERGFGSAAAGIVTGSETTQKALRQMGQTIVGDWIQVGVKKVMSWIESELMITTASEQQAAARNLINTVSHTTDQAQIQQAVATFQAAEGIKTTATVAGDSQRAVANSTENAGFLSQIGTELSQWLGLETAKTGATAAGTAARTTTSAAGAATAAAADSSSTLSSIGSHAASAAAAVFDDVAQIPFVGWLLAPAAAAGAFAAVLAFGSGVASAEGGWGQVPADGMLTELHRNEMVLPSSIATPLRTAIAGMSMPSLSPTALAATAASGPNNGSLSMHYAPQVQAMDAGGVDRVLREHWGVFTRHIANAMRNGQLRTR